jgi:zinc protease
MNPRSKSRLCLFVALLLSMAAGVPLFRDSIQNGLVVLTFEDHRLPSVNLALVCRSGAAHDPIGKSGLASLTTAVLLRGTNSRTAEEIDDLVEYLGADLSSAGDHDQVSVRSRMLSEHLDTMLGLISDLVLHPSFDTDQFAVEQERQLNSARREYDSPGRVATLELNRMLFPGHPYARPENGDTCDITQLTRDDLVAFHQAHFLPNNCFLVAVGDIDHEQFVAKAAIRFAEWKPGTVPGLEVPELAFPDKLTVKLIHKPELNQSYVALGHPGISIHDPDMLPAREMSFILGGSAIASRLGQSVREQGGLAYDVRCWFDRRDLPGAFRTTVQTADPKTAISYILRDTRLMIDSAATQRELDICHNYYSGSYPLRYSSSRGKLAETIQLELYSLGLDWLDTFPDRVRQVGLQAVDAAARDLLHPDRCYLAIVTNLAKEDLDLGEATWVE